MSLGGNSYLSIINDFLRRVWVYILKRKDQDFEKFIEWKSLVKNQCGKKSEEAQNRQWLIILQLKIQ